MDADSLAQVLPDLRGDSKRKHPFLFLISKIGCRHVNVQLLRIRQRDRLFVGSFNAEKVQGGGKCEYQWPCCALLRFKTHVGGQELRSCSVCEYCAPSVMPASVSVVSCEVLQGSTKCGYVDNPEFAMMSARGVRQPSERGHVF